MFLAVMVLRYLEKRATETDGAGNLGKLLWFARDGDFLEIGRN
jgi:hypothetical protein